MKIFSGRGTYIIAANDSIEELDATDQDEEGHEGVEEEGSWGSGVEVLVPDVEGDLLGG